MRFKRPIYRILFFAAWIAVIGGLATLVIAANSKSKSRTCKGVVVSINGNGETISVQKADVLKTIEHTAKGPVVNKHFGDLNLGALERTLEANPWIRDAEIYLDTKDVLHVSVWERQPIARVFNTAGGSFYIDSSGYQLPLLQAYSVRLPVVTGFPATKKFEAKDSLMLKGLKEVIGSVVKDSFWNAQVGQIDITPERKFELIPVVGSSIIKLGYGENVEEKLHNLLVFYKQVLPKAGLAKYSALDVEFDGQVVAVRKGPNSVIDSLQLQRNIEELMKRKAAEQEPDDALPPIPWIKEQPSTINDSLTEPPLEPEVSNGTHHTKTSETLDKSNHPKPNPAKNEAAKPAPQKGPKQAVKKETPTPKAVMPVKAANEY